MNVFTYGSLMFPEVWGRVTGLDRPGVPARLAEYAARSIRGESYPALVRESGAVTAGVLYGMVSDEAVRRLDQFEGAFYRRVEITVSREPEDGGPREERAWVYLAADEEHLSVLPERWDAERFAREGLADFL